VLARNFRAVIGRRGAVSGLDGIKGSLVGQFASQPRFVFCKVIMFKEHLDIDIS